MGSESCIIVVGEQESEQAKSMRRLLKDRAEDNFKTKKDTEAQSLS